MENRAQKLWHADYKNFLNERYHNFSFTDFNSIFLVVLNTQAPIKKRYIRANQKNFMDKKT